MKKKIIRMGVFKQLVMSFVLFALLVCFSLVISLLISFYGITDGKYFFAGPYDVVSDNGQIKDISSLSELGGWVEKLDDNYQIVEVYGEKKDDIYQYTQTQIYDYLNINNYMHASENADQYRGFMKPVTIKDKVYYYLIKVERNIYQVNYSITMTNRNKFSNWYNIFLMVFLFLFSINCILLSLYLSKKIKRPLKLLTSGMQKVREGEDSVRLDFKAQVEFEEIRDTFNLMMDELEQEKKEKEEIERKKKRMLLDLSHDIKTPVTTIKSYANALEGGLIEEDKKAACYKTIDKKASRVSDLVNDMFTMLKMDSTEYILDKKQEDICELTREICVEYYEEIIDKELIMEANIPDEQYFAMVDKSLFSRVISNLISNAIKYNEAGGYLWVTVSKKEETIIIEIAEDGETIEDTVREMLFEPFVRGDAARQSSGGTGLGLAIAKAIIMKHNGTIAYKRTQDKNCFQVTIESNLDSKNV